MGWCIAGILLIAVICYAVVYSSGDKNEYEQELEDMEQLKYINEHKRKEKNKSNKIGE